MTFFEGVNRTKSATTISWSGPNTEGEVNAQNKALLLYERWYNSSQPLISDYLPDRKSEFRDEYRKCRNHLQLTLEYIEDYSSSKSLKFETVQSLKFQRNLLLSIPDRVNSKQLKARRRVSDDIVSDELQRAKSLFEDNHIRAAGVIAGVSLERYLQTLCETSDQNLDFGFKEGISSLGQVLQESNEIDDDDKRLLDYLAGIRNKCSHADEEDPEKTEVERMLKEVDQFIQRE